MNTVPVTDLRKIPLPDKSTWPAIWTRIIFVVPVAPDGTPAVTTTKSPDSMAPVPRAPVIACLTISSELTISWPLIASTPQHNCMRRIVSSCGVTAIILQAGRCRAVLIAVWPDSVHVKIAAAPRFWAMRTLAKHTALVVVISTSWRARLLLS